MECCGIILSRPRRWHMTPDLIRMVHIVALSQKGLPQEMYRLRLRRLGVESSKQFTRRQFQQFMAELERLPDAPGWSTRRQPIYDARRLG